MLNEYGVTLVLEIGDQMSSHRQRDDNRPDKIGRVQGGMAIDMPTDQSNDYNQGHLYEPMRLLGLLTWVWVRGWSVNHSEATASPKHHPSMASTKLSI